MNKSISWNKINFEKSNNVNKNKFDDTKFINLLNNLEQNNINEKKRNFQKWLKNKNVDGIKHSTIISNLFIDLKKVIEDRNFTINNEKQLRNEIATFIYSISCKTCH